METVTLPKKGKIGNECSLPFQASTFSMLVERAQTVFSSTMCTIWSLPGEMVDVLARGHCHQGKLTHFRHKNSSFWVYWMIIPFLRKFIVYQELVNPMFPKSSYNSLSNFQWFTGVNVFFIYLGCSYDLVFHTWSHVYRRWYLLLVLCVLMILVHIWRL